jgi:hypothetical protein
MIPAINLSPVSFTPLKMIAGDNDTVDKFFAGVVVTADKFIAGDKKRVPWRWGAAKDRRKLKGTNR